MINFAEIQSSFTELAKNKDYQELTTYLNQLSTTAHVSLQTRIRLLQNILLQDAALPLLTGNLTSQDKNDSLRQLLNQLTNTSNIAENINSFLGWLVKYYCEKTNEAFPKTTINPLLFTYALEELIGLAKNNGLHHLDPQSKITKKAAEIILDFKKFIIKMRNDFDFYATLQNEYSAAENKIDQKKNEYREAYEKMMGCDKCSDPFRFSDNIEKFISRFSGRKIQKLGDNSGVGNVLNANLIVVTQNQLSPELLCAEYLKLLRFTAYYVGKSDTPKLKETKNTRWWQQFSINVNISDELIIITYSESNERFKEPGHRQLRFNGNHQQYINEEKAANRAKTVVKIPLELTAKAKIEIENYFKKHNDAMEKELKDRASQYPACKIILDEYNDALIKADIYAALIKLFSYLRKEQIDADVTHPLSLLTEASRLLLDHIQWQECSAASLELEHKIPENVLDISQHYLLPLPVDADALVIQHQHLSMIDQIAVAIAMEHHAKTLRSVKLRDINMSDISPILDVIAEYHLKLNTLNLGHNPYDKEAFNNLVHFIAENPSVSNINLSANPKELAIEINTKTALNLLAALYLNTNLKQLDLTGIIFEDPFLLDVINHLMKFKHSNELDENEADRISQLDVEVSKLVDAYRHPLKSYDRVAAIFTGYTEENGKIKVSLKNCIAQLKAKDPLLPPLSTNSANMFNSRKDAASPNKAKHQKVAANQPETVRSNDDQDRDAESQNTRSSKAKRKVWDLDNDNDHSSAINMSHD